MRQILSVSLPKIEVKHIRQLAKKRGYSSVSSYIQNLLSEDEHLISETELLKTVKQARSEYKRGKSIKAKSIADLI